MEWTQDATFWAWHDGKPPHVTVYATHAQALAFARTVIAEETRREADEADRKYCEAMAVAERALRGSTP